MIFMVQQLAEKAIEHQTKKCFVLVELCTAYDSVPREAMWIALRKPGVPDVLIEIVKSFHSDMKARVRVYGELLDEIEVTNGLHQGCTMAPMLFNLYACVMADRWLERVKDVDSMGTYLLYKHQLFCRFTRNAQDALLCNGEFADDVLLLVQTRQSACAFIRAYVNVAKACSKCMKDQVHGGWELCDLRRKSHHLLWMMDSLNGSVSSPILGP